MKRNTIKANSASIPPGSVNEYQLRHMYGGIGYDSVTAHNRSLGHGSNGLSNSRKV